jgi:hypothetical protein
MVVCHPSGKQVSEPAPAFKAFEVTAQVFRPLFLRGGVSGPKLTS